VVRLCFVCLGNICRSPTAHGVFLRLAEERGIRERVVTDSAGTSSYHIGERPDSRSQNAARRRGFDLPGVGRQFTVDDFERFDLVLAMDRSNHDALLAMARTDDEARRVRLLREFDPAAPHGAEVPDPYYGGRDGFEQVIEICEAACHGLIEHLHRDGWL
jgi:protein-tyrosine phosphatase